MLLPYVEVSGRIELFYFSSVVRTGFGKQCLKLEKVVSKVIRGVKNLFQGRSAK